MLENVTFGRDGQPATLVAKSVDIALSSRQLTDDGYVDTILPENGTLVSTGQTAPLLFKADRLATGGGDTWRLIARIANGN